MKEQRLEGDAQYCVKYENLCVENGIGFLCGEQKGFYFERIDQNIIDDEKIGNVPLQNNVE